MFGHFQLCTPGVIITPQQYRRLYTAGVCSCALQVLLLRHNCTAVYYRCHRYPVAVQTAVYSRCLQLCTTAVIIMPQLYRRLYSASVIVMPQLYRRLYTAGGMVMLQLYRQLYTAGVVIAPQVYRWLYTTCNCCEKDCVCSVPSSQSIVYLCTYIDPLHTLQTVSAAVQWCMNWYIYVYIMYIKTVCRYIIIHRTVQAASSCCLRFVRPRV